MMFGLIWQFVMEMRRPHTARNGKPTFIIVGGKFREIQLGEVEWGFLKGCDLFFCVTGTV